MDNPAHAIYDPVCTPRLPCKNYNTCLRVRKPSQKGQDEILMQNSRAMKSPNSKSLHHVLNCGYLTSCNAKNDRNYANYDSSGDPSAESFGNWFRFLVHMMNMTPARGGGEIGS